ncbi:hypothetical protein TNCV_4646021 [Trichonephila clavipes]|nr:hypothetical protein TNCV_4646021 [Trichonephila clavipes]
MTLHSPTDRLFLIMANDSSLPLTSLGVISEPDLLCTSDAEILEGFSDQGVAQTDENITKIKCPPLKLLQPSSVRKPNISSYILSTSASSAQADLLTASSPIAAISESESVNLIPNNVPSTSKISAFPSNSGVQPTSASTSIQDTNFKAKTRARKRRKELLKKINDAIIEIKMAPHKPRKSTPEQDSEDMVEYYPEEFDPDGYVQKYYNIGEYKNVITPTYYKNAKNQNWLLRQKSPNSLTREAIASSNRPKSIGGVYSPGKAAQGVKAIPIGSTKCAASVRQRSDLWCFMVLDLMKLHLSPYILTRLFGTAEPIASSVAQD